MVCKSLHLLSWWRSSQVMSAAWLEYHSMSTSLLFYPFYLHKDVEILVRGLEHFVFFHILGISSSQLTNIFQRGRYTTNQMNMGSRLNFTGVLKAVDGICSQDHDSTMFWWRPPWKVPSPIREASSFLSTTESFLWPEHVHSITYMMNYELWFIFPEVVVGYSWFYNVNIFPLNYIMIYSHC